MSSVRCRFYGRSLKAKSVPSAAGSRGNVSPPASYGHLVVASAGLGCGLCIVALGGCAVDLVASHSPASSSEGPSSSWWMCPSVTPGSWPPYVVGRPKPGQWVGSEIHWRHVFVGRKGAQAKVMLNCGSMTVTPSGITTFSKVSSDPLLSSSPVSCTCENLDHIWSGNGGASGVTSPLRR